MTTVPLKAIIKAAAIAHQLHPREVASHERRREHSQARWAYYHVAVGLRGKQWSKIARALGHDHSSAFHGYHVGRKRHPFLPQRVEEIVDILEGMFPAEDFNHIRIRSELTTKEVTTMKHQPKLRAHISRGAAKTMRVDDIRRKLQELQERAAAGHSTEMAANTILILTDELQRRKDIAKKLYWSRKTQAQAFSVPS